MFYIYLVPSARVHTFATRSLDYIITKHAANATPTLNNNNSFQRHETKKRKLFRLILIRIRMGIRHTEKALEPKTILHKWFVIPSYCVLSFFCCLNFVRRAASSPTHSHWWPKSSSLSFFSSKLFSGLFFNPQIHSCDPLLLLFSSCSAFYYCHRNECRNNTFMHFFLLFTNSNTLFMIYTKFTFLANWNSNSFVLKTNARIVASHTVVSLLHISRWVEQWKFINLFRFVMGTCCLHRIMHNEVE